MKGAQIIIETLCEQGIDTVFGYPGGFVIDIYDELYKNSDRITHFITSHEQGAAHAADGYARSTGRVGVVFATSGPGATNLVTGIATAYLDSTPMLAITGNVPTTLLGKDSFQEVDIMGITMPITKHNYIVRDVNSLADTIREALKLAKSGRPGPVLIDIPKDVQTAQCEFVLAPKVEKLPIPEICEEEIEMAAAMIKESKRPLIYVGGGAVLSDASQELLTFAKTIEAPIGCSMMGLSAVANDYEGFIGMIGMHGRYAATKAVSEADLIIAVGVRFSDRATGKTAEFAQKAKVLHIDIDPAEIGKNIPAYKGIKGDVKDMLTKLGRRLAKQERPEWTAEVEHLKNHEHNQNGMRAGGLSPQAIIECVRKYMPDDCPVATDVGQHQMWTAQYYRIMKPRTFITSGGLGTMGFGMGAAIGACIGTGRRHTVLFTGDGSFHMNMNELATAVTNNLPITVFIMNNRVLGLVRQWQTMFFEKRYSNTTLNRQTDYVKLAEAFGAKGMRIDHFKSIEETVRTALAESGPVVVDCVIDCDEKVLPMIPPGGTIDDIILK